MKIVTLLFIPGKLKPGEHIGHAELSLETYEKISGTGPYAGRPVPHFMLYWGGAEVVATAVISRDSRTKIERYRVVIESVADQLTVAQRPGIWRDVKP